MADNIKDIVKLAVDGNKGNVEKYSVKQSQEVLREALIEANNGKTTLDYRDIRDGKCVGLFAIVEEILANTVADTLEKDVLINELVDYRNIALGDQNLFVTNDSDLFVVAESAEGTQGIRRQRLDSNEIVIPTSFKVVRIYEELNRILAGRVDFNDMIARVAKSFTNKIAEDINSIWVNATAQDIGGATYFPTAGAYDEDALLELIAHVEAASGGKTATIIGTKKAVRNLKSSVLSESARDDLYRLGYYGNFYGSPVVVVPQRHKVGTTEFAVDDNMLTIIAGDEKPIKLVYEGDPLIIPGDPMTNADLTQEYLYGERYGLGIVLANNGGIGRYEISQ